MILSMIDCLTNIITWMGEILLRQWIKQKLIYSEKHQLKKGDKRHPSQQEHLSQQRHTSLHRHTSQHRHTSLQGHISLQVHTIQEMINFSIQHTHQVPVHILLIKQLLEVTVNLVNMGILGKKVKALHALFKDLLHLLLHLVVCLTLLLMLIMPNLMLLLVVCLIPLDLPDHTQCHHLATRILCIVVVALTICLHIMHPSAAILYPIIHLLALSRELSQPRVEHLNQDQLNLTGNEHRYSCINCEINN